MENVYDIIYGTGIVPVVVLEKAEDAVPLAHALIRGGIRVAEVTFRTAAAPDAIRAMAENVPEMLVGAGTVLTAEAARTAIDCGARFIVSPGFSADVVQFCREKKVPVLPGVATPTEMQQALAMGLTDVKFFPAQQYGGARMMKSVSSVYSGLRFMPTGGINTENLPDYMKLSNIIACGGSWLCPKNLIAEGRFDEITVICREAVRRAHGYQLLHVGINSADSREGMATAQALAGLFSSEIRDGEGAAFVGDMFEVLKKPFLGQNGHIAIGVLNIRRTVQHFKNLGLSFREEGYVPGVCAYLQEEIGGFAIHLRQL